MISEHFALPSALHAAASETGGWCSSLYGHKEEVVSLIAGIRGEREEVRSPDEGPLASLCKTLQ